MQHHTVFLRCQNDSMECITHRRHSPYNRRRCRRCIHTHMIFNQGICRHIRISPSSTGIPSFTQSGQVSTPNAPLTGLWNVPGDILDMDDLLGVDLRHDFSAEADQVDERANPRRRNPDRAARNWDRPCGTSSRHHIHSDD